MSTISGEFTDTGIHAIGYPDGSVWIEGVPDSHGAAYPNVAGVRRFHQWLGEFLSPRINDKIVALTHGLYDIMPGDEGRITSIDDEGYHIRFTLYGYQVVDSILQQHEFEVISH